MGVEEGEGVVEGGGGVTGRSVLLVGVWILLLRAS